MQLNTEKWIIHDKKTQKDEFKSRKKKLTPENTVVE